MTPTATARQILSFKPHGSTVLIASMSGLVANKGLISPVYNSSKAALIQLTRNLAMEWGRILYGELVSFFFFFGVWGVVADGDRLEGTWLLMVVILRGRLGFRR